MIGLVKTERTIQTLLAAMHLPTGPPKVVAPGLERSDDEGLEWSGGGETTDWPD